MYLSKKTISDLEAKLQELNRHRPILPSILKKIRQKFQIEMTYNSNAIEGNSLTLKETFWVINEGITIKEKPLKDHLEAKNHQEALDFLYDLIDSKKRHTISEHLIKQLHQLVVRDSERDIAGIYRNGDVMIAGADHKPPSYLKVPQEMQNLIKWLRTKNKQHVVENAAILHHRLAHIHPFWDGNGRTARLVMNILIMSAGYPLTIILKNDRKRYYRVLAQADKGNYQPLSEFIAQATLRSLSIYLSVLAPDYEKFESLSELSKKTTYSAAYLKKLILNGKLEGHKEGRNWLSSEKALKKYLKTIQQE